MRISKQASIPFALEGCFCCSFDSSWHHNRFSQPQQQQQQQKNKKKKKKKTKTKNKTHHHHQQQQQQHQHCKNKEKKDMWDRSFARQRATKTNANCKRKAHKRKRKSVYGAKHNSNPESKGGRKEERKRTRASRRVTRVPTRKLKKRHNGKREEIGNATKGVKSALFLSRGSLWLRRLPSWQRKCRPLLASS